jgi:hypothetical protein
LCRFRHDGSLSQHGGVAPSGWRNSAANRHEGATFLGDNSINLEREFPR